MRRRPGGLILEPDECLERHGDLARHHLIECLRGHETALAFLSSVVGRPAVSVTTIAEFDVGAGRAGDDPRIERLLDGFDAYGVGADTARTGVRRVRLTASA